jgi:hypothetical protein
MQIGKLDAPDDDAHEHANGSIIGLVHLTELLDSPITPPPMPLPLLQQEALASPPAMPAVTQFNRCGALFANRSVTLHHVETVVPPHH